jgi:hypothetical protein
MVVGTVKAMGTVSGAEWLLKTTGWYWMNILNCGERYLVGKGTFALRRRLQTCLSVHQMRDRVNHPSHLIPLQVRSCFHRHRDAVLHALTPQKHFRSTKKLTYQAPYSPGSHTRRIPFPLNEEKLSKLTSEVAGLCATNYPLDMSSAIRIQGSDWSLSWFVGDNKWTIGTIKMSVLFLFSKQDRIDSLNTRSELYRCVSRFGCGVADRHVAWKLAVSCATCSVAPYKYSMAQ